MDVEVIVIIDDQHQVGKCIQMRLIDEGHFTTGDLRMANRSMENELGLTRVNVPIVEVLTVRLAQPTCENQFVCSRRHRPVPIPDDRCSMTRSYSILQCIEDPHGNFDHRSTPTPFVDFVFLVLDQLDQMRQVTTSRQRLDAVHVIQGDLATIRVQVPNHRFETLGIELSAQRQSPPEIHADEKITLAFGKWIVCLPCQRFSSAS